MIEKDITNIDRPILVIMSGLPGSGKTSFAKSISEKLLRDNSITVSPDEIRKEYFGSLQQTPRDAKTNQLIFKSAHLHIAAGLASNEDVIFDATNLSSNYRRDIYNKYKDRAFVIIMQPDVSLEQTLEQNKSRDLDEIVPEDVIMNMFQSLDQPVLGVDCDGVLSVNNSAAEKPIRRLRKRDYVLFVKDEQEAEKENDNMPRQDHLDKIHDDIDLNEKEYDTVDELLEDDSDYELEDSDTSDNDYEVDDYEDVFDTNDDLYRHFGIGNLVEFRNGERGVIANFKNDGLHVQTSDNEIVDVSRAILDGRMFDRGYDIVKISDLTESFNGFLDVSGEGRDVIWEGNPIPLLTSVEYTILSNLSDHVKQYLMTATLEDGVFLADGELLSTVNLFDSQLIENRVLMPYGKMFTDFADHIQNITVQDMLDLYKEINSK